MLRYIRDDQERGTQKRKIKLKKTNHYNSSHFLIAEY